MWPFKKKVPAEQVGTKTVLVRAKVDGVVESIMYDHIIISGKRYDMRVMLVEDGQTVKKNQPIGKK